jgi:4-hydroxy-2-oxoheptanedioate aldolase
MPPTPIADLSLKARWQAGQSLINGWCALAAPAVAEIVAEQGFDSLTADLQHSMTDLDMAVTLLRCFDRAEVPTLARVPTNEPGLMMKLLDAGYGGIICPLVNTEDDAWRFVSACRYHPRGGRSFGPIRASLRYGPSYVATANDHVTTLAMIETAEAMDNLDRILAVEELDAVYIGPSDLALSLGVAPAPVPTDPKVLDAIREIRERATRAGKAACIHCGSPEMAQATLAEGFRLVTITTDARIFAAAVADWLKAARAT